MIPAEITTDIELNEEEILLQKLKHELAGYFGFAKQFLANVPDGTKVVQKENAETITKEVLSPNSKKLAAIGMGAALRSFANLNDMIKMNNNFYVLLHDTSFSPTETPAETEEKVVINQHYEFFYMNVIESNAAETEEKTETYLFTPMQGMPILDLLNNYELSNIQKTKLALDILRCTVDFNAKNLVHRNIKPEKFVVTFDDNGESTLSLIDFSNAKPMKEDTKNNEFSLKGKSLVGTEEFIPPAFATTPGRYAYNFATEIYAAAISTLEILRHINRESLSSEENSLLLPFMNAIETLAQNITSDSIYINGNPRISPERKLIIIQDISRLEAMYLSTQENLESSQVVQTVFKRAESPSNKINDSIASALESPAGVDLIHESTVHLSEIPETVPYSLTFRRQLIERILHYKDHRDNKTSPVFFDIAQKKEATSEFLARNALAMDINKAKNSKGLHDALVKYQTKEARCPYLLVSLVELINTEIERKKPTIKEITLGRRDDDIIFPKQQPA